jgi:1,2-diacylglycerol 3-alpha-glucosyltransferase
MKQQLMGKGVKNIVVAPVGLDLSVIPSIAESKEELRSQLQIPLDKTVICCVSRLDPSKQPLDFFELTPLLDPTYYYVFIGDGIQKNEFKKRIETFHLNENLRYIDKIANGEIHKYFRLCDYLVNFNDNEIFGMSILEAMYQGCTVVAKKAPGPDYIIEDGISGYLVGTIEQMADTIKTKRMTKEKAIERVMKHFTWDTTASIVNDLYSINR